MNETRKTEGVSDLTTRSTSPIDCRIVRLVLGESLYCTTNSKNDCIGADSGCRDLFRHIPGQLGNDLFLSEIERSTQASLQTSMAKAKKSMQRNSKLDRKNSADIGHSKAINQSDKSLKKRNKVSQESCKFNLNSLEHPDENYAAKQKPKFSSKDQVMDLILSKIQV